MVETAEEKIKKMVDNAVERALEERTESVEIEEEPEISEAEFKALLKEEPEETEYVCPNCNYTSTSKFSTCPNCGENIKFE